MTVEDAPTPAELGRWMRGVETRMESGFKDLRGDVAEVRVEVRGLSFVRSDVYASDQRSRDNQLVAMEKAREDTVKAQDHRISLLWGLFWALLSIIIVSTLGVIVRLAGAFG